MSVAAYNMALDLAQQFCADIDKMLDDACRPAHLDAHLRWVKQRNQREYQPVHFREHWQKWGTVPAGSD